MQTKYIILIVGLVVVAIIVYYSCKNKTIEGFNPYLDKSRIYPGLFALNTDPGIYPMSNFMFPEGPVDVPTGSFRYNPGYRDYSYIPQHEMMKSWMGKSRPESYQPCFVPNAISEYCVQQKMMETGNLDLSISSCRLPGSVSETCMSQQFIL